MEKPTPTAYAELQQAYDFFNGRLFEGKLPDCLITLQRKKSSYGYFSPERFVNKGGKRTDEIAMNPTYFAVVTIVAIMQTLVHEMAHLWQFHYGNPGRARYHNKEWGDKMKSLGLMPSSTGKPGGKETGDCVSDYPIEGGAFMRECKDLLTGDFQISWYERFLSPKAVFISQLGFVIPEEKDLPEDASEIPFQEVPHEDDFQIITSENNSNRSKYSCAE